MDAPSNQPQPDSLSLLRGLPFSFLALCLLSLIAFPHTDSLLIAGSVPLQSFGITLEHQSGRNSDPCHSQIFLFYIEFTMLQIEVITTLGMECCFDLSRRMLTAVGGRTSPLQEERMQGPNGGDGTARLIGGARAAIPDIAEFCCLVMEH